LQARRDRAKQAPIAARAEPSAQSAAGFLERFRQSLALAGGEAEEAAQEFGARGFARFRPAGKNIPENGEPTAGASGGNELRHYLNNRLGLRFAASASGARKTGIAAPQTRSGAESTVLASLDTVIDHSLAACQGATPRALLVCGAPSMADATAEAISIARALVAADGQVVLLDLAHGPSSVSGALGLPRSPGLADLSAGRVRFEDIVGIDAETPLHVIAAGNPRYAASADENARLAPIFAALIETYDSVVLYADSGALRRLAAERRFEFPIVVVVVPAGTGATADLSDFAALGSRLVAYEQGAKERRPRFLGWAAGI
jgi:Mrp family chromosome partitioning ATPase